VQLAAGFEPTAVESRLAQQLEREGALVRLGDGLAISVEAYERARAILVEECAAAGTISLARYRDLLGSSRRVAQLVLERLDADRVTLRTGDVRRLRRSAGHQPSSSTIRSGGRAGSSDAT
jgi:selenocysteine-specific elongation factor